MGSVGGIIHSGLSEISKNIIHITDYTPEGEDELFSNFTVDKDKFQIAKGLNYEIQGETRSMKEGFWGKHCYLMKRVLK